MSAENIELLRRAWETMAPPRDPSGLEYLAEDVVFEIGAEMRPDAGTSQGREDYVQLIRSWTEVWADFRHEPREFIDGGDDMAIVVARARGRSRETGIPYEADIFYVYNLRGDQIARIRQVPDRATAFAIVAEETGG